MTFGDAEARRRLIESRGDEYWNNLYLDYEDLRLSRLAAYLRKRRPDDQVNHTFLIYRLSDEDVSAALVGPPPELGTR